MAASAGHVRCTAAASAATKDMRCAATATATIDDMWRSATTATRRATGWRGMRAALGIAFMRWVGLRAEWHRERNSQ